MTWGSTVSNIYYFSFYNPDDMGVNCPGPTRDDHDSL